MDDFLFLALTILRCNYLIQQFLALCNKIGIPIAQDKTEWASELVTFLGVLLNGRLFVLSIPLEKRQKAETLPRTMIEHNKVTVKELQTLCGYLNFLGKAIYPGRAFTWRMYSKYAGLVDIKSSSSKVVGLKYQPKQYHHVKVDWEFKGRLQGLAVIHF